MQIVINFRQDSSTPVPAKPYVLCGVEHVPRVGELLYVARGVDDDLLAKVEVVTKRYTEVGGTRMGFQVKLDYVVVVALGLPWTHTYAPATAVIKDLIEGQQK